MEAAARQHYALGEFMTNNTLKITLLSGVAVVALLIADPKSASAQMYSSGPGFYVSLEGRYLMANGPKIALLPGEYDGSPSRTVNTKAKADKGWGGKGMLGYRFNNNWDIGFGFSGGWLNGKKNHLHTNFTTSPIDGASTTFVNGDGAIKTKLSYQVADFEAGYNWTMGQNSNLRLFGGVRFAHFAQRSKGSFNQTISSITPQRPIRGLEFGSSAAYKRKTTFFGVGPRLGVNGQFGVGNSGFNVFGGVSGALLYGKYKDSHSFDITGSFGPTNASVKDKSKNKIVPNAEGEIGLGYTFNAGGGSTVGLQIGYRGEGWWGVASKAPLFPGITMDGPTRESKSADVFIHGPFVRLIATFGTPAAAPMAPPPPPPPPMNVKSFIVFFDFDKSNITAEAQKTINDAVAAAKAGGSSRVTLTGHTDRSGSEQYNMALSLRRAEAVKANMIRQGVPASAIVVIGKGESAPLVPTADGVREPQNRRVEIVI